MSRLSLYKTIKNNFSLEKYVTIVQDRKQRSLLAKSRMGILPVKEETGRYRGINKEDRLCVYCDQGVVESGTHFILHCPKYGQIRKPFYDNILSEDVIYNDDELMKLFVASDKPLNLYATAKFIYDAMNVRSTSAP